MATSQENIDFFGSQTLQIIKDWHIRIETEKDLMSKGMLFQNEIGRPIFETVVDFRKGFSEHENIRQVLVSAQKQRPYLSLDSSLGDAIFHNPSASAKKTIYDAKIFPVIDKFCHPYTGLVPQQYFKHSFDGRIGISLGLHGMIGLLENSGPQLQEKLFDYTIFSSGFARGSIIRNSADSDRDVYEMKKYGATKELQSGASFSIYDAVVRFSMGQGPYYPGIQNLELARVFHWSINNSMKTGRFGLQIDYDKPSSSSFWTTRKFQPGDSILFFFEKE